MEKSLRGHRTPLSYLGLRFRQFQPWKGSVIKRPSDSTTSRQTDTTSGQTRTMSGQTSTTSGKTSITNGQTRTTKNEC